MATQDTERRQIDTFGVFLDIVSRNTREADRTPRTRPNHHIGVVTEARSETIRRVEVELKSRPGPDGGTEATRAVLWAYDPDRMSAIGDRVEITPNRSTSRLKRWRVVGIVTSRPGTPGSVPAGRNEGR